MSFTIPQRQWTMLKTYFFIFCNSFENIFPLPSSISSNWASLHLIYSHITESTCFLNICPNELSLESNIFSTKDVSTTLSSVAIPNPILYSISFIHPKQHFHPCYIEFILGLAFTTQHSIPYKYDKIFNLAWVVPFYPIKHLQVATLPHFTHSTWIGLLTTSSKVWRRQKAEAGNFIGKKKHS